MKVCPPFRAVWKSPHRKVSPKMKLSHITAGLQLHHTIDHNFHDLDIKGIADSSKAVKKDFVFIAIRGYNDDGHRHIGHAIENGATAVIGELQMDGLPVPYLRTENTRKALGIAAKNFYGDPASRKTMIGITGTNGKTTTSYLIRHLLEKNGISCSVMGTIRNIVNGHSIESPNTTPSSLILQQLLASSDDEAVVMEVSSHGLSQHRIEGVEFDICLFTNLQHEHLDYHGSMDSYFDAKKILFNQLKPGGTAIINIDDEWGEKLSLELREKGRHICSIGQHPSSHIRIRSMDKENSSAVLDDEEETILQSPIAGTHNIYNSLMAYASALGAGLKKEGMLAALQDFPGVEGRFERSEMPNGSVVIVDYAHTPDAIYHCLTTAKEAGARRVTHIYGFRGDRDTSKRMDILDVSSRLSDHYTLTTDDLNSSSSQEMESIYQDLNTRLGNDKGQIEMDRTLAIKKAIDRSQEGDWIIITGKGHEKYSHQFSLPTLSLIHI